MFWSSFPMLRWALCWVAGLCLWQYGQFLPPSPWLLICLLLLFCFVAFLQKKWWRKLHAGVGLLACLLCLLLGWQWGWMRAPENHALHLQPGMEAYMGIVEEAGPKGVVITLASCKKEGKWVPVLGKVQWQLPPNHGLLEGMEVLAQGSPSKPYPPAHPAAFDYGAYLRSRDIHYLHRPAAWKPLGGQAEGLLQGAARIARHLEGVLRQYIASEQSQAIAAALVLGRRSHIDPDLRNHYAVAGVMHVLAVSGMHVAILYGVIAWALAFLGNAWKARLFRLVLQLVTLWGYALLTGFSASVVRSAAMLSIFALGQASYRKGNGLNTLGAAAFLMLLLQPGWLKDLGFQLSFLAVLGLMLLYAPLERLWQTPVWLWRQLWQLSCMSVAAQLATLPITLLYFHQFPTYFLLANWVVVPLSSLLLIGGLLLLCLSPLPWLPVWLGYALDAGIQLMNICIEKISLLYMASIDGIFISPFTAALLYVWMGGLAWVWLERVRWPIWLSLGSMLGLVWLEYAEMRQQEQQASWSLYKIARRPVLGLVDGQSAILLSDTLGLEKPLRPHLQMQEAQYVESDTLGGRSLPCYPLHEEAWLYMWKGKSVLWLQGCPPSLQLPSQIDLAILSSKAYYQMKKKGYSIPAKKIWAYPEGRFLWEEVGKE